MHACIYANTHSHAYTRSKCNRKSNRNRNLIYEKKSGKNSNQHTAAFTLMAHGYNAMQNIYIFIYVCIMHGHEMENTRAINSNSNSNINRTADTNRLAWRFTKISHKITTLFGDRQAHFKESYRLNTTRLIHNNVTYHTIKWVLVKKLFGWSRAEPRSTLTVFFFKNHTVHSTYAMLCVCVFI